MLAKWMQGLKRLRRGASRVLAMNNRNLGFVYPSNARSHFPYANDKLLAKATLEAVGVPVPATHYAYRYFFELSRLREELGALEDFVIKPAQGSGGNGILVIAGRDGDEWLSVSGRRISLEELQRHITDIIFGVYSHDMADVAIVEDRIIQNPAIDAIYDRGLADVRLILYRHEPVLAMSRIPTSRSDGRANLHQGAVGIGIDLESGRSRFAMIGGQPLEKHPDSGAPLIDFAIPYWAEVMEYARRAAESVPLKYLGVDVAIAEEGPVILEINARPGLEIQNANFTPMRALLEAIHEEEKL